MNGIMATRGRQGWDRRERGESERFKFMKREENSLNLYQNHCKQMDRALFINIC